MQTLVARRRAAIDFFLKTDLDHNMLEVHRDFRTAVKALKLHLAAGQTVKSFEESDEKIYRNILKYLNIHELKRFPPDLNRRDSQRVKDERFFVH